MNSGAINESRPSDGTAMSTNTGHRCRNRAGSVKSRPRTGISARCSPQLQCNCPQRDSLLEDLPSRQVCNVEGEQALEVVELPNLCFHLDQVALAPVRVINLENHTTHGVGAFVA